MDSPAMKAIVTLGVLAFLLLGLASFGLKRMIRSSGTHRVTAEEHKSPFDSRRAFNDLQAMVALGPRIPGSPALEKERGYLKAELGKAGIPVREQVFDASTPLGAIKMVNLVAEVTGDRPGVIILSGHYDTKYLPEIVFVGANDAGSSAAWLIEMARTLGPKRQGRSVWLCFFDGEEAFGAWSETDSLYGSRAFVDHLRTEGTLKEIAALINVDMIGDCYLGIKRDPAAPTWLTRAVWGSARDLGYGEYFLPFGQAVEDDHVPFRRAGVSALNVIDFTYGKSRDEHDATWHTAHDTLDRVCPESLQAVGDVIYHALGRIDAHLDAPASR